MNKTGRGCFEKGHVPWIKGKTKETNSIIKKMAEKHSRKMRRFTDKEENRICGMYIKGLSAPRVAQKFNVTDGCIFNILKRHDVERRKHTKHKYIANYHYFDVIDCSEKAYWIGFLYADGSAKKTTTAIALKRSDEYHLEKFKEALNATHPVKQGINSGGHPFSYIQICDPHMAKTIRKFKEKMNLEEIPVKFHRDFIRGFKDGDGGISYNKKNYAWIWSLLGPTFLLIQIQKTLVQRCNLNKTELIKHPTDGLFYLAYGGTPQVKRIEHFLYNNASIYLSRKYKLYQQL